MTSYSVEIGALSARIQSDRFAHPVMQGEHHVADICATAGGWAIYDLDQVRVVTSSTVFGALRDLQANQ